MQGAKTDNMEVHHHPHVEKKNFKEYVLEFIMIFLAVTLGFFAENIREHFSDNSKEKEYIQSLYEDTQRDSINVLKAVEFDNRQMSGVDELIQIINAPAPDSNQINTAYYFGRLITRTQAYDQADRTLQQLNSSGNFRLIKNADLANSIVDYENTVSAYKENHRVGMEERKSLYPFISVFFDANVFPGMINNINHISKVSGIHSFHNQDKALNNQFIYYLHQVKSTLTAEKIGLNDLAKHIAGIRGMIRDHYNIEEEHN